MKIRTIHSAAAVQTVRDPREAAVRAQPVEPSPRPAAESEAESDLPAGLPANWTFPRDLPCPQCSYNLRARREPLCPECGLRFRWQSILGAVCPECAGSLRDESGAMCPHCFGTLNWVQILGKSDPCQQLEFEYSVRWLRPFLLTLLATLNPWRFWNARRLDAPPNRARLVRFRIVAIAVGLTGLALPLLARALGWVYVDFMDWVALAAGLLLPPAVCLSLIDRFGWSRMHQGLRWERTTRAVSMSSAVLAWHGLMIALGVFVAAVVNALQPVLTNRALGRPANALRLSPDTFFSYLITGDAGYYWHPIQAWFNIGLGAMLTFFAVAWWWPFLYLSLRRGMKLRDREALPLLLSGLAASYLLVFVVWMHTIPLSPFVSWLTGYLR